MLNATSRDAVNSATFSQRFVKPLYESYCFSNIPGTIELLLTGETTHALPLDVLGDLPQRYDKVIFFFVDAFGWRFFERYADRYPFLKTILNQGVVSMLTSQFPSTTAVHTTSINTGLNVGQSGVYEWNYYEPLVDDIITPLLFSYAREERDTLKRSGLPAAAFYPAQTFYQGLKAKGVVSHIFMHQSYAHSTYSSVVCRGAQIVSFRSLTDALNEFTDIVLAHKAPPYYYYLYFDRIDALGHLHGPDSPQFEREVDVFFQAMEQLFTRKLRGKVANTLFLMTADHGMIDVYPQTTVYLNKVMPGIERSFQTTARGQPRVPAGSARDMFLHVKDELLDELCASLRQLLAGKAEVYKTADLLAQHFFGDSEPSAVFLGRVGNLVILPYQGESVWWYEPGAFEMRFLGHHGGLTPEEMKIPLLAWAI
jgi:predicted AlkP superfamily pyrophosphatase or phosphodiesterase